MPADINKEKTVMALGFFDGVHRGHGQLISTAVRRAKTLDAKSAVLSFDVSPESVVTGRSIPLIGTLETREDWVRRIYGADEFVICHFDKGVMAEPWRDFLDRLIEKYNVVHFVIGHDFHCGYKGEGNPDNISAYCREKGIGCDVIPKYRLDGITVSSTYIRSLIAEGDIERANFFLGHPYSMIGRVAQGHKVGRKLGTPTVNIPLTDDLAKPPLGVYSTKVSVDGREYAAVTNVGVRPTFGGDDAITVESFILDFCRELYGKTVRVDFYKYIRPERRFDSPEELKTQIEHDAETSREYLKTL